MSLDGIDSGSASLGDPSPRDYRSGFGRTLGAPTRGETSGSRLRHEQSMAALVVRLDECRECKRVRTV